MDSDQFDRLSRVVASASTRRASLGIAATFGLGSLLAGEAKKKRKKKKKKCKSGTKKCGKRCIAATACCSNNDCGFQGACESGVCDCKSGAKFCQDTCVPVEDCCASEDCADIIGQTCQDGQCACPSGQQDCNGTCRGCCTDDDCDSGEACLANGSCTLTCEAVGFVCPAPCSCDSIGIFCSIPDDACSRQICPNDGNCPVGQVCAAFDCGFRCAPVCDL